MQGKKLCGIVIALFASAGLAACSQANALPKAAVMLQAQQEAVAQADIRPSSDAQADNGPGCAESTLTAGSRLAARNE